MKNSGSTQPPTNNAQATKVDRARGALRSAHDAPRAAGPTKLRDRTAMRKQQYIALGQNGHGLIWSTHKLWHLPFWPTTVPRRRDGLSRSCQVAVPYHGNSVEEALASPALARRACRVPVAPMPFFAGANASASRIMRTWDTRLALAMALYGTVCGSEAKIKPPSRAPGKSW